MFIIIYCFIFDRERKVVHNGLSPGIEEQSEYFDATEHPLKTIKDKRPEDDEDSGVDNASQILRDSSVSSFLNIFSFEVREFY